MTDFWQINYAVRAVFCDVNDTVMIIKQVFSIKSVNNGSSVAWRSRMWKGSISSSERLSKYNYIYIQWWDLYCCLFCTTTLFRVCISLLLCRCFVNEFILRCLHFLCLTFFFVIFCFCILFQQSKYINSVIYSTHCILD